jgi:hypothetical protein
MGWSCHASCVIAHHTFGAALGSRVIWEVAAVVFAAAA